MYVRALLLLKLIHVRACVCIARLLSRHIHTPIGHAGFTDHVNSELGDQGHQVSTQLVCGQHATGVCECRCANGCNTLRFDISSCRNLKNIGTRLARL